MNRLLCVSAVSAGVFYLFALIFGSKFCLLSAVGILAVFITVIFLQRIFHKHWMTTVTIAAFFSLIAVISSLLVHIPKYDRAKVLDGNYVESEGTVISVEKKPHYLLLTLSGCEIEDKNHKVSLLLPKDEECNDINVGTRLKFSGELEFESSSYSKGKECFLFTYPHYYENNGHGGAFWRVIGAVRSAIEKQIDTMDNAPLLKALILGDKSEIPIEVQEDFKNIGASHLLAISGLHLSIIIMSLYELLTKLRVPNKIASVLCSFMSVFYLCISGFSLSLLRASQMMMVFFFARSVRREKDSLTSLMFAALTIITLSPWSMYNLSFLLSFFATLGIIVFTEPVVNAYRKHIFDKEEMGVKFSGKQDLQHRITVDLISAVCTTLSATATTMPIILLTFNEISAFAIIGNLFTIPLTKHYLITSFPAVLMMSAGVFIPAYPLSFVSSFLGRALLFISEKLSDVSPPLICLDPAYLTIGILIISIIVLVFLFLPKTFLSLPLLTALLIITIPVYNFIAGNSIYHTAVVNSIVKSGSNTTLVRWRDKNYILDQTSTASTKLGGVVDVVEKQKITQIDEAVFVFYDKVFYQRISTMLSLFDVEKITVVTNTDEGLDELYYACENTDVCIEIIFSEQCEIADGIKAYLVEDVCTAFVIENGDNSFCNYRSYSEENALDELLKCDELVFYGKSPYPISNASTKTSFRITT